ncbi:MAG: ATP-binding cassette domain-containing protein, partial [Verrucomicrobiota bacterium]
MSLLGVEDLRVHFPGRRGWLGRASDPVRAVDGVSFSVEPGETVGLVGESGCGKTTLGRAVVRLVEPTGGRILFEGEDLAGLSRSALRARRRRFQM